MSRHRQDDFARGAEFLRAEQIGRGRYRYYAQQARRWYLLTRDQIIDMGRRLRIGQPDAYSLWCGDNPAPVIEEAPHE